MDIRNLFNLVLLGLSLTTLLITLISYILFRVRYSLAFHKKPDLHKVEGQFFRRYAPHLEEENWNHKKTQKQVSDRPGRTRKKVALVFGLAFLFVMGLIAAEQQFSFRTEMARKVKSAEEYRRLLSSGLLKTHQLDLSRTEINFAEHIPSFVTESNEQIATHLSDKKVRLISSKLNRDLPLHGEALQRWQDYLNRQKISYQVVEEIPNSISRALLIFPQIQKLSQTERNRVDNLRRSNNLVVTGGLGIWDESNQSKMEWFENIFKLKVEDANLSEKRNLTTFYLQKRPWWNLPAGLLLPWFPIDSRFRFSVLNGDQALALEANFRGEVVSDQGLMRSRLLVLEEHSQRMVWTALDPQLPDEELVLKDPFSLSYSDGVLSSSLLWAAQSPQLYLGAWPNGQLGLINVSLNLNDLNEESAGFIRKAAELDLPMTLFLASQTYKANPERFEFLKSLPQIEIATMGSDGQSLRQFDKAKSFVLIENSRLDIEEQSQQEVQGFKPPQEEYNEDLLDAAAQNGLHYFFGDRRFARLSPVELLKGDILFIPRSADDDLAVRRNHLLDSPEEIVNYLLAKSQEAISFGGLYSLNLNTGIVQEPFYSRSFIQFLKEVKERKVPMLTLSAITRWWELRSRVKVSLLIRSEEETKVALITLNNQNSTEIDGISLFLDPGQPIAREREEVLRQPAGGYEWRDDHFEIMVPRLSAKEIKTVKIILGPNNGN